MPGFFFAGLGSHRQAPPVCRPSPRRTDFEDIVGISLLNPATLKFRPWPPENLRRSDVVKLELEPRSIYLLRVAARWQWQRSVAPTRYSITLRTARQPP